jgi:hypothetical protein
MYSTNSVNIICYEKKKLIVFLKFFFYKCASIISSFNWIYTQVVDNGRIMKGIFWSIMDHYSQDAHWMMITSNDILGGISKWYIIAIICYL